MLLRSCLLCQANIWSVFPGVIFDSSAGVIEPCKEFGRVQQSANKVAQSGNRVQPQICQCLQLPEIQQNITLQCTVHYFNALLQVITLSNKGGLSH